mgnify:CR=1 FL=1
MRVLPEVGFWVLEAGNQWETPSLFQKGPSVNRACGMRGGPTPRLPQAPKGMLGMWQLWCSHTALELFKNLHLEISFSGDWQVCSTYLPLSIFVGRLDSTQGLQRCQHDSVCGPWVSKSSVLL